MSRFEFKYRTFEGRDMSTPLDELDPIVKVKAPNYDSAFLKAYAKISACQSIRCMALWNGSHTTVRL